MVSLLSTDVVLLGMLTTGFFVVIILYDYLLTFDREVLYIWRRRFTSANIIYVLLRYVALASLIVTMLNVFPFAGKTSTVSVSVSRINLVG